MLYLLGIKQYLSFNLLLLHLCWFYNIFQSFSSTKKKFYIDVTIYLVYILYTVNEQLSDCQTIILAGLWSKITLYIIIHC